MPAGLKNESGRISSRFLTRNIGDNFQQTRRSVDRTPVKEYGKQNEGAISLGFK